MKKILFTAMMLISTMAFAQIKISALSNLAKTDTANDVFPIVHSGTTYHIKPSVFFRDMYYLPSTRIAFGNSLGFPTNSADFVYSSTLFEVAFSNKDQIICQGGVCKLGDIGNVYGGTIVSMDAGNNVSYFDNNAHNSKAGINTGLPSFTLDVSSGRTKSNPIQRWINSDGFGCLLSVYSGSPAAAITSTYAGDLCVAAGNLYIAGSAGSSAAWAQLGKVTTVTTGNLSPLFTASISNSTTTPALAFTLSNAAAHTFLGNTTGSSAAPSYSAITTSDMPSGIEIIKATADLTAQTAAVSSVATTTPSANGTYRISGYINVTAISAATITLKVTYTDENSNSVTQIIPVTLATTGAIGTTATTVSNNSAVGISIRAKSGSAITVLTTLSGVSATYDVGARIIIQ